MLGVWLENETKNPERKKSNVKEVLKSIELANQYPNVLAAVNVGNETQVFWSWHRMKTENLIRYIRAVRNNIHVPVTTADDYNFWNKPESQRVAKEVDFIVSHIYPLWNGKILENAIEWMGYIYHQEVQKNHPEKVIAIGEPGWATTYNPEKKGPGEQGTLVKGEVSIKAQEQYLIMLNDWVNKNRVTTFLFEAFDEPWKGGGETSNPSEIEKHWGVFYENRMPKESFQTFLKHIRYK
jgi:exo-beta-1,3-glucanase (GH17 family)